MMLPCVRSCRNRTRCFCNRYAQTLTFEHGIVRKTFLLAINDDNYPEGDETFQLILSEPTGGASLGNQYITQVTILDDETLKPTRINFLNSTAAVNISSLYPAGQEAQFSLITRNYQGVIVAADASQGISMQIINKVIVFRCSRVRKGVFV